MVLLSLESFSDKEYLADWIEFHTIYNNYSYSKAYLFSIVERYHSEESEEEEDFEVDQSLFVDDVWGLLENRERLYGTNPPYNIHDNEIEPKISFEDCPAYIMCLLLSMYGNKEKVAYTGKLFEKLSSIAIQNYINGAIMIYGHPSPTNKVKHIADTLGEFFVREPHEDFKDRGLDIVAWKPFEVGRCGQLVALFQCACGSNWNSKLNDLSSLVWNSYISWGSPPIRGFVFPKIHSKSRRFYDDCLAAGIIFDRARVYKNIANHPLQEELRTEIIDWCKNIINLYETE